jgi:ABC-2 type transport system permease protein
MKSLVALIKREYLEHRGAFLYAPGVILGIMTLVLVFGIASNRFQLHQEIGVPPALKFFEFGFLAVGLLWCMYLLAALFFYYADAFSADRRNNAMLFWKSMPVTDFKVLAAKSLAGMTILPALIFAAFLLTGVLIYIVTMITALMLPRLGVPSIFEFLSSAVQISGFALVALAAALLWYAPFFAWVGALSTVFRRWSIPLAFLIPGLIGLAEKLVFDFDGPRAGYFLSYLSERMKFGSDNMQFEAAIFNDASFNAPVMISRFLADIDWSQLVGGLIVAALLVYASSEYRRRTVAT